MRDQHTTAAGFTILEVMIVSAILAVVTAIAVPSWRTIDSNARAREAAGEISDALAKARVRAIASGNNHVVYFNTGFNGGTDVCGNALEDANGDAVPILVLDDGAPGNPTANCCIDLADTVVDTYPAARGIFWGANHAAAAAPDDTGAVGNYLTGSTFSDQNGGQAEWIMFRPDGVPVGFTGGGACNPGPMGSGGGAIYITNNDRDYAVSMTPLGGIKVYVFERSGALWTQ